MTFSIALGLLQRFWKPIAGAAVAIALVLYLMHLGAEHQREKQATIDAQAALLKAKADTAKALDLATQLVDAHNRYAAATERTAAISTEAVKQRVATQTITKELIREVKVLIPADAPAMPGAFRLLHDSAAAGVPTGASAPTATSRADAASVPAATVAETVIDNYGTYQQLAQRMQLLQRWVNKECH